jgi:hypothetical protein
LDAAATAAGEVGAATLAAADQALACAAGNVSALLQQQCASAAEMLASAAEPLAAAAADVGSEQPAGHDAAAAPVPTAARAILIPQLLRAASAAPRLAFACALLLGLALLARGPVRRLWRIYATAAITIATFESLRRCLRTLRVSASAEASTYALADSLIAPYVCAQLAALKSLWVKFGQYIGSRADIVPPSWARALEILQDDLPADSRAYVRALVRSELGVSVDELFSSFDETPMASASVAQVRGWLTGVGG